MFRTLLAAAAIALAAAAPASAQDATAANLDRAAAYWGASPDCPNGVHVTVDEAFVGPDTFARGGGCGIWVGDRFAAESAGGQCQTIVHEWGHLLGYGEDHAWHEGLPADPAGVMSSYALPPSCAALDAPAPVATPAPSAAPAPTPIAPAAKPSRRRRVARPPLPSPMPQIVVGSCPGYTSAPLGCYIKPYGATLYGYDWSRGVAFTDGDPFTTAHELGHAFYLTMMGDGERNRFNRLVPGATQETFADAYASCRLDREPGMGHVWDVSVGGYTPTAGQQRRVCRMLARAGVDAR